MQQPTLRTTEHTAVPVLRIEDGRAAWAKSHSRLLEVVMTSLPLISADAIAVAAAGYAANALGGAVGGSPLSVTVIVCLAVNVLLIGIMSRTYPGTGLLPVVESRRLAVSATLAFATFAVFSAFHVGGYDARFVTLGLAWLLSLMIVPAGHSLARAWLGRLRWWGQSAVVAGSGDAARSTLLGLLKHREQGLRPRGIVSAETIAALADQPMPDPFGCGIVVVTAERRADGTTGVPDSLHRVGSLFPVTIVLLDGLGSEVGDIWLEVGRSGDAPAVRLPNRLLSPLRRRLKRAIDVVAAGALLVALVPLLLLIALLVKLTSRGPMLYGHRRIGRCGRPFTAWKFRTMVVDADEHLEEWREQHPALYDEWQATQKLRVDPRVTRVGRFLRRSSLDELPQLWNTLVGQMSFVGPRPIVEDEIERYGASYNVAYAPVRPGITGLWQVSGRNDTTYERRIELDSLYVRNWSVWMDLYIMARTVKTVVFAEGAC